MNDVDLLKEGLNVIKSERISLERLEKNIGNNFVKACKLILQNKGRLMISGVGKSGHIGNKLAATFSSLGTPCYFVHAAEAVHGDSGMIEPDDIVIIISNSGETMEVLNFLPILLKRGVTIIAVTAYKDSTLAKNSNLVINTFCEREADFLDLAPTNSSMLTLCIGDALAITVARARGFSKEKFALFHPGGSLGKQLREKIQ